MSSKMKRYTLSEVIEYLEVKMLDGSSTYSEDLVYQDYKWENKISKRHMNTIKKLVREMNEENGF